VLAACALLAGFALSPLSSQGLWGTFPADPEQESGSLGASEEAADVYIPALPHERSKKEEWLLDKATRHDVHVGEAALQRGLALRTRVSAPASVSAARPVGTTFHPITTLYNLWTKEALPLVPGFSVEDRFNPFLRDHFTNQATHMDARLIDVLTQVARRFRAARIEVVSGYRSPKYNLMLRKKGHQVARSSEHMEGHAVDFRVQGVPTPVLLRYVKSLHRGGVGYYPHSQFVHSDTGKIRFWRGS
jgi:hypothetical protein